MSAPQKNSPLVGIAIVTVIVGLIVGLFTYVTIVPYPVDDAAALRAVGALGYTEPKILARHGGQTAAWQSGCDEGVMYALDMQATGAADRAFSLLVCCGGLANRTCSVRAK